MSWKEISSSLPKDLWISKVIASKHKTSRIYACLNGYRWDHFESYIYVSEDFGKTWNRINNNLPNAPVNSIIEDIIDESLLFLVQIMDYASFNFGQNWHSIDHKMPNLVDLVIQPVKKIYNCHARTKYLQIKY